MTTPSLCPRIAPATIPEQFVKMGNYASATTSCRTGVPKGSVLGPLLFTAYVSPVCGVIESFGVGYHQFADDTQLYIRLRTQNLIATLDNFSACSAEVQRWFLTNGLQLNATKPEVALFGTRQQLQSVGALVQTVDVAGAVLPVASAVLYQSPSNLSLSA